ncbi:hypothetical protein [Bordetella genomosp. 9]|uniref:Lipoprotein n=1 Tax=Bordetella genomosp. 9 TaxID=1416803 RepID=A0A1W6Z0D7_9BORD|nr:hypothetical protein [Bordetella genomosp. 9]ARP86303.1 hypothetical protein CAL13_08900 [Bordetella genomosp. 9]
MRLIFVAVLAIVLSGCASKHPPLSREEFLKVSQRVYDGKTPEQVFAAAEKLFRLADGNDFTYTYSQDGMTAQRQWSFYFVLAAGFGADTWTIKTSQDGVATKVSVDVSTTSSQALGPTLVGNYSGTSLYDLFWSRLDYLLGQSNHWMTCEESNQRIKDGVVWGSNDPLCDSVTVNDDVPEELRGVLVKQKPSRPNPNPT